MDPAGRRLRATVRRSGVQGDVGRSFGHGDRVCRPHGVSGRPGARRVRSAGMTKISKHFRRGFMVRRALKVDFLH